MSIVESLRAPWRVVEATDHELIIDDADGRPVWHVEADNASPDFETARRRGLAVMAAVNTFATFAQHDWIRGFEFVAHADTAIIERMKIEKVGPQVVQIARGVSPEWAQLIAAMLHAFERGASCR